MGILQIFYLYGFLNVKVSYVKNFMLKTTVICSD